MFTRRSVLWSMLSAVCAAVFRRQATPEVAIIGKAPNGGPPITYLVQSTDAREAINRSGIPPLGSEWPMDGYQLLCNAKHASPLGGCWSREWVVTCEWKRMENSCMNHQDDPLPIIIDYDGTEMSEDAVRELIDENTRNMLNPDYVWPTDELNENAALFRAMHAAMENKT